MSRKWIAKEGPEGQPWLMAEDAGDGVERIGDAFRALTLMPGITLEQAEEIVRFLGTPWDAVRGREEEGRGSEAE